MNKKALTETDICDQFITPAVELAVWNKTIQIRREYAFSDGKVMVRGKIAHCGKRKRADYILFYQANLPLAVIEATDNSHLTALLLENAPLRGPTAS